MSEVLTTEEDRIAVTVNGVPFVYRAGICRTADVGLERDGCFLGVRMHFEGDGWGVTGPGICLDSPPADRGYGDRVGTAYGCEFIIRVLRALGVEWYADVKRRPVDVLFDGGGWAGSMLAGFRCRKCHGGSGEWLVFKAIADPATGAPPC